MKSPQSYTDCHDVNTLTVSIRQKDILISGPINVNTLNISLNMKNVEISILISTIYGKILRILSYIQNGK